MHDQAKLRARLASLNLKHTEYEHSIQKGYSHYIDDQQLKKLKQEKLFIKQEIQQIKQSLEGSE